MNGRRRGLAIGLTVGLAAWVVAPTDARACSCGPETILISADDVAANAALTFHDGTYCGGEFEVYSATVDGVSATMTVGEIVNGTYSVTLDPAPTVGQTIVVDRGAGEFGVAETFELVVVDEDLEAPGLPAVQLTLEEGMFAFGCEEPEAEYEFIVSLTERPGRRFGRAVPRRGDRG